MTETFRDQLDAHIAKSMKNPGYRAAYEDSQARNAILDALVAARRSQGITQNVVAQTIDVTQSTVSQFESEGSDPRLRTLQRYARAVGMRVVFTLAPVEVPCNQVLPPDSTSAGWCPEHGWKHKNERFIRVAEGERSD